MELEKNEEAQQIIALMSNVAVDGVAVDTEADMVEVAERLREVKALQKRAADAQKAVTQPLEHAKKSAIAWFRERITNRLDDSERMLKRALLDYQQKMARIAAEAQRKADEAARKERERLARRAAHAAEKGQAEKAEALQEQAATVVAPVQMTQAPKVAGISMRQVWSFEITDPKAIPREYLCIDESKIRKVVQALKGDCEIDGVRVYVEQSLAAAR